uniref:Thiolase N-terminal domain-containing protein n=1 Tax=Graphocephala atropunctata TaxID=36148 RepID=A0A1B6LUS4_9HEMI
MTKDVVIVSAARTPIGSFCGSLSGLKAHDLGSIVIQEVLKRASVDPSEVSEVVLGQALTAGEGQNPARQAAVKAGLPYSVPAYLINLLCGSGIKTVVAGCQALQLGDAKICVCGGQESMSQAPHYTHLRGGVKLGNSSLVDHMLNDGLTDAFFNIHMGETAENLATQYAISREEQDKYVVESQRRTAIAQKEGHFKKEIVPVHVKSSSGDKMVSEDEYPRPGTTLEGLAKLEPRFVKGGTVTAGNASGMNDGAAAVLLMMSEEAKKRGLSPLARIVAYAIAGCDPKIMGFGPVPAVKLVLEKAGWSKDDVDLYELNEAYASQSLVNLRELGVDPAKVNVSGGAISLGHPIAASGTRVLVTLLYALQRTGGKRGVASLCIGGGMGIALAVQRD